MRANHASLKRVLGMGLVAFFMLATPAAAHTVTVTVKGVASADGTLRGLLCTDAQKFPGGACPYKASARAADKSAAGEIDLVFKDVADGTYAFQSMHDANDNQRLDLPTEGFAFGNSVAYPPNFDKASIKVASDTNAEVTLTYFSKAGVAPAAEIGVPPRAGIVKTDLRVNGLYGALYAPKDAKNLPVIVAIGGSEGGLDVISGLSMSFASHGYAVLALAYWRAPGLPQTLEGVPLEYFSRAVDWLETRPEIDKKRIGLFGWSRGGEGALLIASHEPRFHAVTAMSPGSHVMIGLNFADMAHVRPAWTVGGQALPYTTIPGNGMRTGMTMRQMMDAALAEALKHPEAEIPVEKINGDVLLLTGSADPIWPGPEQAERVIARLKANHFKHAYSHIDYPGAGHLVFSGDPKAQTYQFDPSTKAMMGGKDDANAAAKKDAWEKTLAFYDRALKVKRPSAGSAE